MAYTSVIPVRRLDRAVKYVMNKEKTTAVSLQDALDYAANRDKTEQSCFESSYACTLETAFADMRQTKEQWHKSGGVQGYHLVQSFAAGEVTPELAHQIAKELADRFGVSESSFKFYVKGILGESYLSYFRKKRMEKAAELLESTTMKVIEVANAVGYENQGKFAKVFAETYGVPPLEFRRLSK